MAGECGTHEGEVCKEFWGGSLKERNYLVDLAVGGMVTLKWIVSNRMRGRGLNSSGSEHGKELSCSEHDVKHLSFIKRVEFLG
jgi:hypothetical protein